MVSFLENLWSSIFTPGPTHTLLVATNATFAALQLLLFMLLLATYSIHFVILSFLTAGLWWAINWFAGEIRAAQSKEEEAKRIRDARKEERGKVGSEGEGMDTGDDTEVDTVVEEKKLDAQSKPEERVKRSKETMQSTVFVEHEHASGTDRDSTPILSTHPPVGSRTTGIASGLAPMEIERLQKRRSMAESTGDMSTDSEWERVSEDSGER
ncbi:Pkr1-domain-containing protein [Delitschia confertaspora ATCC 74209]|uniref:Pkr1-domain-containing protein n=1 Tax=Delitschia confertaspora ATCC 74209 TaxID=1513339 RepID=A0A9P4JGV6_9PLEO|nr:Pkr1-domain-containing protein [Delitschia confertaspora ATCC 74209]